MSGPGAGGPVGAALLLEHGVVRRDLAPFFGLQVVPQVHGQVALRRRGRDHGMVPAAGEEECVALVELTDRGRGLLDLGRARASVRARARASVSTRVRVRVRVRVGALRTSGWVVPTSSAKTLTMATLWRTFSKVVWLPTPPGSSKPCLWMEAAP